LINYVNISSYVRHRIS